MTEKRREQRFPARIVARVFRRGGAVELLTNDVSFRGVFIRTDSPPQLRQLVKVELVLPDNVVVGGHAMVVHVAPRAEGAAKGEGPVPGIGLQFWGPLARAKEWQDFIHDLRRRAKAGLLAAKAEDKVRRASERFKLAVEVVFDGMTSMTRDLSENGMAIRTDTAMPAGMRASLSLRAGDELLTFDVVVRRTIDEPGFKGLGVELVDPTPEQRDLLMAFIRLNTPSEERIFVAPADPRLH